MYIRFKRVLDILLALGGIVVLSPLLIIIALSIKLNSKGPIFFKQKRVGIHKTHFDILKFRTMRIDAPKDVPTHLLDNPDRHITPIGKFLRKTSLDELPQIFNILAGSMSFIGPRPALWNQFDLIAERDKYFANEIRPGLSGWAQINGRDELPIEIKARYDGEYASSISLKMDIKCFVLTLLNVFKGHGIVEGRAQDTRKV